MITITVEDKDANVIFHALNYTALGRDVVPAAAKDYRRVRDLVEKQITQVTE